MRNVTCFEYSTGLLHLALALGSRLQRITERRILVLATHLAEDLLHELVPGRGLALATRHRHVLTLSSDLPSAASAASSSHIDYST